MSTTEKKVRRVMTQVETIRVSNELLKVLLPFDESIPVHERVVSYMPGWDDDRVAKLVAPDLTAVHVGNLRNNVYGTIKHRPVDEAARITELEETVTKMQQDFAVLMKNFYDLSQKHDKLCSGLSVARVVDARHLMMTGGKDAPVLTNGAGH